MIIAVIVNLFLSVANFFVNRLPTTGLPSAVTAGVPDFFHKVYDYNSIFPINTIFGIMIATGVFWAVIFGWDIIKWFIHLFRGN